MRTQIILCPAATYAAVEGYKECVPCGKEAMQDENIIGATSASTCKLCPPGFYNNNTTACTPCPFDMYQPYDGTQSSEDGIVR